MIALLSFTMNLILNYDCDISLLYFVSLSSIFLGVLYIFLFYCLVIKRNVTGNNEEYITKIIINIMDIYIKENEDIKDNLLRLRISLNREKEVESV